jgi:hypothetical protein
MKRIVQRLVCCLVCIRNVFTDVRHVVPNSTKACIYLDLGFYQFIGARLKQMFQLQLHFFPGCVQRK